MMVNVDDNISLDDFARLIRACGYRLDQDGRGNLTIRTLASKYTPSGETDIRKTFAREADPKLFRPSSLSLIK